MIISVILLSLEFSNKETPLDGVKEVTDVIVTSFSPVDVYYGYIAIAFGMMAPACFTVKAIFLRLSYKKYNFKTWDLGIDGQLIEHAIHTLTYISYIYYNDFILQEFVEGQVSSVLFLFGSQFCSLAFSIGPGGPVNALISS